MKNSLLLFLYIMILAVFSHQNVNAQGSTSSRISGSVSGDDEALIGATVLAVHLPTGFEYGTVTNEEGIFNIQNMNVGGPYKITTSYVGYEENVLENLFLTLGQTQDFNIDLSTTAVDLSEIVVTSGGLFDGNRTGSETKVSEEAISTLPSADRGLNDYLRLTPQASVGNNGATNSGGISFAGVNNRFNSIFIDGAVNNDVFGLANSGTNGGQAGISPISPDAIEQIQVVLAPYDVTLGGFAGGGINAVTRSGTNDFKGSAYYFFRNEGLAGKTPTDVPDAPRTKLAPFDASTFGFRVGGPIIKNKLFFFTNVEIQRDEAPRPFVASDYIGASSDILGDLDRIRQTTQSRYGYDPGGFLDNPQTTDGEKILFKIDWNINAKNKFSFRHSYVKGTTEIHPTPSDSRVIFNNVGYIFPSTTNSSALELKSIFNNNVSNNLILGLTTVRDDRDILGDPFPQIILNDGAGQVVLGTDNFSYSNIVFQDVFTLTNNLNVSKGKHTYTFGTHNEFFKIQNLFTIFSTPRYEYFFDGINRYLNDEAPDIVLFGHEQLAAGQSEIRLGDDAENLGPTFNALQMAFYAQDEYQINKDFKLTYGLRFDIPIFLEDPPLENTQFNSETVALLEAQYDLKGARASNTPNTQILISPRVGFNWDVNGDRTLQFRGGAGIFTSRVPWVWPGGMFIRNGLNSAFNVGVFSGTPIYPTEQEWKDNLFLGTSPTGDVDLFVDDFKYPQIARMSLGLDKQFKNGINGTFELTYTKTLNNIDVKAVNIAQSNSRLTGADNRALVDGGTLLDPTYQNITLVDNTNKGYTFNLTAQLSKSFSNGFFGNVAYSFTRAEALFDGSGFINSTNWLNILSTESNNNPSLVRSIYDAGSRITAFLSKRFEYGNFGGTTLSVFYTGKSGQPYTYIYSNSISDIANTLDVVDPIYVPANASDINLVDITTENADGSITVVRSAEQQWTDLDAFISGDDYLSERRGDYVEPNKVRTPFEHIVDLKFVQDFFIETSGGKRHTMQFTFDIFNFTNLLNKDWGRRYFAGNNLFPLIGSNRVDTENVEYTFTDPGDTYSVVQSGTYSARWVGQIGLRYIFD